jgi:superfamily II DNA or RNA helicase
VNAPIQLRNWQAECLPKMIGAFQTQSDFLVTATPGAGKTALGLAGARAAIDAGLIDHIHVVTPTRLIRRNWQESAARLGLSLERGSNGGLAGIAGHGITGRSTTYAQVADNPEAHAAITARRKSLVILDELHHAGDENTWGDALRVAFSSARFRLELSGTPFRADARRIPFVNYRDDGTSIADYAYGYDRALADGVCRPVIFSPVNLLARFAGTPTDDEMAKVLKRSLHSEHGIIEDIVRQADADLTAKRERWPDAGGLLVAVDQRHAYACADVIRRVTGESPPVVVSDNKTAERDLVAFRDGASRWAVAVKMVSEGVDIPRLMVAAYASNVTSTLFFRQFVGRFVRVRQPGAGEIASIFVPRDIRLVKEAAEINAEVKQFLLNSPGQSTLRGQIDAVDDALADPGRRAATERAPSPFTFKATYRKAC